MSNEKYIKEIKEQFNFDKGQEFLKNVENMGVESARDQAYYKFISTFMRDTKAKEAFFNNLERQGYGAIVDDYDNKYGNDFFTEAPLIVFKKSTLEQTESKPISKDDWEFFSDVYWGTYGYDDDEINEMLKNAKTEAGKKAKSINDKWNKWVNN